MKKIRRKKTAVSVVRSEKMKVLAWWLRWYRQQYFCDSIELNTWKWAAAGLVKGARISGLISDAQERVLTDWCYAWYEKRCALRGVKL